MNRKILMAALMGAAVLPATGRTKSGSDSVKTILLEQVQVVSNRATRTTPVAFTNISKATLARQTTGIDLPFLLLQTPSLLTTSDAGAGIGYTGLRIRGTDASRINVTANGVPMNDPESHTVYWVNTPDLSASTEDIQVQRGVGTSTSGAGAFGGSVSLSTQAASAVPYAELGGAYGSYHSQREMVKAGTGLMGGHFAVDLRLSQIKSNGYRDRASANLKSYFAQGTYFGEGTLVKLLTFGGREETYHAWDGISREQLRTQRQYNPNGLMVVRGDTTGYYGDQTDNYRQTHWQLIAGHRFSARWMLNAVAHYTHGFGYYQEYKNNRSLKEYLLEPFLLADGTKQKKSNLVRQKMVNGDFGGGLFDLTYSEGPLRATLGGGLNRFINDHYGRVIWVMNYAGSLDPAHEYYRNKGRKTDGNLFLRADYRLTTQLSAYADVQYRYIHYTIDGTNDKWDWTADPGHMQNLNISENFSFLNPKAGIHWQTSRHGAAYASFAIAQKEPTRNNYTDGLFAKHPTSELLRDYEAGYTYSSARWSAGLNLYLMYYSDQLVLNGRLNEIGEPMAENVRSSYRAGMELTAGVQILPCLRWDGNMTWSCNRIKHYTGYVYDESIGADGTITDDLYTQTAIQAGSKPLAFSPSLMGNSTLSLQWKHLEAFLQTQAVSRQYLDNFGSRENSLDAYCVSNLHAGYTFALPSTKGLTVGVTVYNLLNKMYENNGYSQTVALYPGGDKTKAYTLHEDPRFYPMAGTNVMVTAIVKF